MKRSAHAEALTELIREAFRLNADCWRRATIAGPFSQTSAL